jgi:hypothetical protein
MIKLHGPSYQYQGQILTTPEIIWIQDHHYCEHTRLFAVEQLLKNSVCDSADHVIVFDHVLMHDDVLTNYAHVCFPSFLARENTEFTAEQIIPDWTQKTSTFNFIINKPRPHRILLLELIQKYQLQNYCHSLAWQANTVNDVAVTDYKFGNETVLKQGIKNGSYKNAHTYKHLLKTQVIEPSCISLITEPAFYERETIITEKTLMAMWAGTIPVWVGGWRIADWLRSRGFDVFDDIVNHNYQQLQDPHDRCRQAIELNLPLLKNFNVAFDYFIKNQTRFQHNLDLLRSDFFRNECLKIIKQTQGPVQNILRNMLGVDKV